MSFMCRRRRRRVGLCQSRDKLCSLILFNVGRNNRVTECPRWSCVKKSLKSTICVGQHVFLTLPSCYSSCDPLDSSHDPFAVPAPTLGTADRDVGWCKNRFSPKFNWMMHVLILFNGRLLLTWCHIVSDSLVQECQSVTKPWSVFTYHAADHSALGRVWYAAGCSNTQWDTTSHFTCVNTAAVWFGGDGRNVATQKPDRCSTCQSLTETTSWFLLRLSLHPSPSQRVGLTFRAGRECVCEHVHAPVTLVVLT